MLIEYAAGKKTGSAHMCKQPGNDIGILDEAGKDLRRLNARKQFAQRPRQCGWTARISLQRHLLDEIGHHNAGRLVHIPDLGRNPRLCGNAHGHVLVWISKRTGLSLDPQQIWPLANLYPIDRCRRRATGERHDRADPGPAKRDNEG
jgi:hypothetical protein